VLGSAIHVRLFPYIAQKSSVIQCMERGGGGGGKGGKERMIPRADFHSYSEWSRRGKEGKNAPGGEESPFWWGFLGPGYGPHERGGGKKKNYELETGPITMLPTVPTQPWRGEGEGGGGGRRNFRRMAFAQSAAPIW